MVLKVDVPVETVRGGVEEVAHSQGLIDYDAPVASYWPEFGANGKGEVTVRQLLSHQAGVCAIDERLELDDLLDLDRVAAAIARQAPGVGAGDAPRLPRHHARLARGSCCARPCTAASASPRRTR